MQLKYEYVINPVHADYCHKLGSRDPFWFPGTPGVPGTPGAWVPRGRDQGCDFVRLHQPSTSPHHQPRHLHRPPDLFIQALHLFQYHTYHDSPWLQSFDLSTPIALEPRARSLLVMGGCKRTKSHPRSRPRGTQAPGSRGPPGVPGDQKGSRDPTLLQ